MHLDVATARRVFARTSCLATRRRLAACCLLSALVASGCESEEQFDFATVDKPPAMKLTRPEVRNIVRIVGQPSFIEAYERSSVFPKLTGYIEKWKVDIGDKVKRGETLATLFVPELVEDFETKKATVNLDKQRIELAKKVLKVAAADVKTARARLEQAKAILDKYKAEVERWDIEVKRLKPEVEKDVVDKQILLESSNQLKSSIAAREAASADIEQADAELVSRQANLEKATVDVQVAEANLGVAESEARRLGAWVGYLKLPAPFDGVIVVRNANTFDFVLPATGDPTAMPRSPHRSPSGSASPIYVVDRTDIVRVFVDIPEQDANYVQNGTKATVLAKAYSEKPIPGSVTRTSWALNVKSRTLLRRDRLEESQQQAPARHVCIRQGDHRAPERPRAAAGRPHLFRREKLLLEARGRESRTAANPNGRHRRHVDRDHRLPEAIGSRRNRPVGTGQRIGAGHRGRRFNPFRGRSGGSYRGNSRRRSRPQKCPPKSIR